MPRVPRLELSGGTFHITAHGNRGDPIFEDREDSLKFLSLFETICSDHEWDCFAFVLMPGQYRLTLRTNEPSLAKGMQRLNGRYAGFVNRRRQTSGHLLGGRYQAVLVEADNWLPHLVRLSALAPVRAGLAERPEQYLWSSWRSLLEEGRGDTPLFLKREEVLAHSGIDNLPEFVGRGLDTERDDVRALETLMRHNQIIGSGEFAREISHQLGLKDTLASSEPRALAWFRNHYKPSDRAMAAARFIGGYRQKDIAASFDTHVSTVSRAGKKYEQEFAFDQAG